MFSMSGSIDMENESFLQLGMGQECYLQIDMTLRSAFENKKLPINALC